MNSTARPQKSSLRLKILLVTILLAVGFAVPRGAAAGPSLAPVPHIDSISPVSAVPGAASFTLTVTGTGFVANSAVFFGSSQLATTFMSSTTLTAFVSAAMLEASGTGFITVVTPGGVCNPGGGTSNTMFLPVIGLIPSLTFAESANAGSNGSWGTIAGDFNNDGVLDLVTANRGSNTVTVFLGNGNGTFQTGRTITVFAGAFTLAEGDLNHDGNLDLVVTSLLADTNGGLAVLMGNGDGTFQSPVIFTTDHGASHTAALADVNGDGSLDLLSGSALGGIDVFLGNGDGTFQAPVNYGAALGSEIQTVLMADMNGDGKLDIVTTTGGSVAVLTGVGDGTFNAAVSTTVSGALGLVVADFDGDGKLDAVTSAFQTGMAFLKGNGDGTFQGSVAFGGGVDRAVEFGDFNGDGKLDVVTQNETSGGIDFYLGNGDGTFQAPQSFGNNVNDMFQFAVGNFATGAGLAVAAADSGTNMLLFQTAVAVSPMVVDFGSIGVNATSDPMTVTVTNGTPVTVNISSITIVEAGSSVDFAKGTTSCGATLAAGAACTVQVTFTPTSAGALSASIQIVDDAPGSPQSATLSGTGTNAPLVTFLPAVLTFAPQNVGSISAAQTATLTNAGNATLNISNIAITGANFADFADTTSCGATLAASANCTFSVTITPGAVGARTASLMVTDDAVGSPHSVALSGTGVTQGTATLSVNTLTFETTVSGVSSATQVVTVTNTGGTAIAITSIAVTGTNPGDFLQTNTCSTSLATSSACTITVTFKPTAGGARAATITLTDGAVGSPQLVTLSGTGQDFTLTVTTPTQTIAQGATANIQIAVTPQGGFTGLITLACSGAPSGSTCTVAPTSFTPTVSPTNVTVSLVTTAQIFNPPSFTSPRQFVTRFVAYPLPLGVLLSVIMFITLGAARRRGVLLAQLRTAQIAVLFAALLLAGVFGLAGCGSSSSGGVSRGSHVLTMTASSGQLSHNATMTVIVQ
jgi:FG-GAP-like repeat/Abnormal spindle-like microcephaly-assoc'd, ASPM-SPD-2-Hydin